MELRSYSVERIYGDCVKTTIGNEIGVNKEKLAENTHHIKSMIRQLPNNTPLNKLHIRVDGETWTPYLQIVKMLVLLGEKIGAIEFEKPLEETTTIIKIIWRNL